jgi:hypothetical protein
MPRPFRAGSAARERRVSLDGPAGHGTEHEAAAHPPSLPRLNATVKLDAQDYGDAAVLGDG